MDTTKHKYTNELIHESSPYLLQHAHNPVNWYPWGEKALKKAKDENKLILVSIGYAACHWCHVMEHESFEDSLVAKIMNDNFINIKVDREERPDVDDIYMTACQLVSGQGGWPLNAVALPDGRPVWAGTYFPKERWKGILEQFKRLKENDYQKLVDGAEKLTQGIQQSDQIVKSKENLEFKQEELNTFNQNIFNVTDYRDGGRKGAPKFPMPSIYEYLLEQYRITGDSKLIETVDHSLKKIADGGIYDHLGGGFARYAVDAKWLVPHFEKMLYDNGQLVSVYARAYKATKNPQFKAVVEETIDFVERELSHPKGAFYASLDADSEGEEGKFYVWNAEELKHALGTDYEVFADYYTVRDTGNWEEEKNILHRKKSEADLLKTHNITSQELQELIQGCKTKLMPLRDKRVRPGLDDKVITSWNALMISGYVEAFKAFQTASYKARAIQAMDFIIKQQEQKPGQLFRNFKDGKSTINAFLDDYALTILALIDVYEITFDAKYLEEAKKLAEHCMQHFLNEETGMFYYTSDLDPPLVARKTELNDNVIPGSNSSMARALHELGILIYEPSYNKHAAQMLSNMHPSLSGSDRSDFSTSWCMLYNDIVHRPYEIAIVGPDAAKLRDEMTSHFLPDALFIGGETEGDLKLLKDKLQEGETFIYVCQNQVCKFPVQDVPAAIKLMTR